MKRYFPVLLSKAGEIIALTNLSQNVKEEIAPIIQVLTGGYHRVEKFASTEWSFDDNELFLDFSLCDPFDRAKTRSIITNLSDAGVNVIPVLQSNSHARYTALLQNLIANGTVSNVCIRFSNGSGGFININAKVATILGTLAVNRNQASIFLDLGFVENHNYNMIAALAINIITAINNKPDYNNISSLFQSTLFLSLSRTIKETALMSRFEERASQSNQFLSFFLNGI